MFHAATQNTAAQQKRVNFEGLHSGGVKEHADDAVIAKTVAHFDGQAVERSAPAELADFRLTPPPRRAVELIRTLRELRDSRQRFRCRHKSADFQIEAGKKARQRRRRPTELFSRSVLLVERRSATVLLRDR